MRNQSTFRRLSPARLRLSARDLLGLLPGIFLAACGGGGGGGGDDGSNPGQPFTAQAQPFQFNDSEPFLDFSSADSVLAGALSVVTISRGLIGLQLHSFENGTLAPGHYPSACDAGTKTVDVTQDADGFPRVYTLAAAQCFTAGSSDNLIDGTVVRTLNSGGVAIDGTFAAGTGGAPANFVVRNDGLLSTQLLTGQPIRFQGDSDGSPLGLTINRVSLLLGSGSEPVAGVAFQPSRWLEARLAEFSTVDFGVTNPGSNYLVTMSGPITIRGVGLSIPCSINARFIVEPRVALRIGISEGISGGTIGFQQFPGGATQALVEFEDGGGALVTTSGGGVQHYSASQIESFCS